MKLEEQGDVEMQRRAVTLKTKMTLTKFIRHVTLRVFVFFFGLQQWFYISSSHFVSIFDLQNQWRQIVHVLH